MESKFKEIFDLQRENARAFQKLYKKRIEKQLLNGDSFPDGNLTISRRGKKYDHVAMDGTLENKSNWQHKQDCPERDTRNHANGFEYQFKKYPQPLIDKYAKLLFDGSEVLQDALISYGGMWRLRIQNLESAVYRGGVWPRTSDKWGKNYPSTLTTFEFLVPGIGQKFISEFENLKIKAERIRGSTLVGIFSGNHNLIEYQKVDNFQIMNFVMEKLLDAVNDFRASCVHPAPIECGLCGDVLEPALRQNTQYMLPENYCPWCVLVIDYHDETEFLYEGIETEKLRNLMMESFARLVELSGFPYWNTPVLTFDLMVELNLRERDPVEAKELSYLLACLPKRTKMKELFETPQHFFHEAGLEALVPRGKGRGIRSISRCAHLCLSMGEREICEYLHENGQRHSKEPIYAELAPGSSEFGAMRGDFLAGNTVIEYAGLEGDEAYDAKMQLKMELAKKYNISLIVVGPKDLKNLSEIIPINTTPTRG
jgi:hypothetical protein